MGHYNRLSQAIQGQLDRLKWDGREVDTGHWQGYETQGRPDLITDELINVSFDAPIPHSMHVLEDECRPNMPWAEMEFQERVAGHANNPHHSLEYWPYWSGGAQAAATHAGGENFQFTHTYSERFWPNYTGEDPVGKIRGIRYQWGDLDDVLDLLQGHPYTRQATFPIFFPEDTGAVHGGRIPCTLHYHFLLRDGRLHVWYPIRSCDAVRHFRDDIYMACRLGQWVLDRLQDKQAQDRTELVGDDPDFYWSEVEPGNLYFTAYSFHVHRGDKHKLVSSK